MRPLGCRLTRHWQAWRTWRLTFPALYSQPPVAQRPRATQMSSLTSSLRTERTRRLSGKEQRLALLGNALHHQCSQCILFCTKGLELSTEYKNVQSMLSTETRAIVSGIIYSCLMKMAMLCFTLHSPRSSTLHQVLSGCCQWDHNDWETRGVWTWPSGTQSYAESIGTSTSMRTGGRNQ